MPKTTDGSTWRKFIRSVWFFPTILAIPLICLTVLRISGSSIGMYHQIIYGAGSSDSNLLFGHPRPIRSDEWLVASQLTIAQQTTNYPRVNSNLGGGKDMSLTSDVPYKDWSAVFKPENFSFFVMPFQNAFAFKWWLMLYGLMVSCYFFTLRIIRNNRLFAALFGLAIGLSPFIFWWYIASAILPMVYGFLILIISMRIINDEPIPLLKKFRPFYTRAAYALSLAYLLVAFGLILYPPFQIPVAIVVAFFLAGYILDAKFRHQGDWKDLFNKLAVIAAALVITGGILIVFIASRSTAIRAMTHTVYPGSRVTVSGHINPLHIFDSFMQPQLESEVRGTHFFNNQSETSNFILLSPFLVLPALFLTYYEYKKYRRIDWLFVSVQACVLLFFARVFLPVGSSFYKLLFLHWVPNERLLIGIGLAGVILTLLVLKKLGELQLKPRKTWLAAAIYSLVCLAVVAYIGFHVSHLYPRFISYPPKILALAIGFCGIIFLVLSRRLILAASLLLLFSFGSVVKVHPLYRGLGWIGDNQLFPRMRADSGPRDTWVVADNTVFENFGLLAGRDTISGVQPYPDLKLWSQADSGASDIYNRYAHALWVSNPSFSTPLKLIQPDLFEVGLNCDRFLTENVKYVLDANTLDKSCLALKDTVKYTAVTFYIYKVKPAGS